MKDLKFTVSTDAVTDVPFKFSDETVSGSQLLAQKVIILMLTSDKDFLRDAGGNLYYMLKGVNIASDSLDRISNLTGIAITNVADILVKDQESNPDTPPEERLNEIRLANIQIIGGRQLYLELEIHPEAGAGVTTKVNLAL